jgi:hypothetical protein
MDVLVQGLKAAWPGAGTPTALQYIGRGRGVIRGQGESDENYVNRLIPWLDRAKRFGSMDAIALGLHEYLANHPRVRVVNRAGYMVTCETDGTLTRAQVAWDWDSFTDPGNATHWWDEWIIVYPTQWPSETAWGPGEVWGGPLGFGHDVTREEVDAVLTIIRQTKAEHSFVRSIIWSYDALLFDPMTPSSFPDGTWGTWAIRIGGVASPSGRDTTNCRFWEAIS